MKKQWFYRFIAYAIGSVLYALSVAVFSSPNDIAPGGVAGIGILVQALWGVPVGVTVVLLNIPLIIAAFLVIGRRFALSSSFVILLSSVVIDAAQVLLPPFTGDRLLASLFGGLLSGLGVGIIMRFSASTGGSEIAAMLLQKRREHLSVGTLMLLVDAVIVAASVVVYGEWATALYASVQVFVVSVAVDRVLYSHEEGRLAAVVTSEAVALCRAVDERLSRGATVLQARGGYTADRREVVLCAVSRRELPLLKRCIEQVDARAFVMVLSTEQVLGEGFIEIR